MQRRITIPVGFLLLTNLVVCQANEEAALTNGRVFLQQHCVDCHAGDQANADWSLDQLQALEAENAELWQRVVTQVVTGNMPPAEHPQPSQQDVEQLTSFVRGRLEELGIDLEIDYKLKQPDYANLINHDKLFDGSVIGPAFSPPRLWRLHPEAYEIVLEGFGRQLNLGGPLSKPFLVGDGKGIVSNYASLMKADAATLGQLMLNCKQIAEYQTVGFRRMEKDRRTQEMVERHYQKAPESFLVILNSQAAVSDQQIAAAVAEEFRIVLSRKPSDEEAIQYAELLKESIEIGGKARGLRTMATALLLRPEAIYRMEVGLGAQDEHGRRMLSSYELAHAIAYALTDTPPEQLLLGPPKPRDRSNKPTPPSLMQIADEGKFQTREDVRRVVTQIWEHESVDKPRILRFFREFFGYHTAETVFKGDRAGKEFAAQFLVKDADMLIMHLVNNDHDVLKELLTTDRYFVHWLGSREEVERKTKYITDRIKPENTSDRNYKYFIERSAAGLRPMPQANPTWRKTVRFYNLHEETWDYPLDQPFAMPAGQRVGILTHPAWLAAWSGNFENDPIRRGKWIREHLLAGSVPDVPITVDAQVPEDPHKTLRDRLQVTRQEYCWQCHRKMEPLGLPLEAYDDFGQYRTAEGLGHTRALTKPKLTAPLVTTGQIIGSGDAAIDGDVEDVHELMGRLADSPRVRQSFVRHAFRYWMGRNEMTNDSPTLIAADKAYVDNGGSFKSMVIQLLTSDSFLYRK